MEQVNFIENEAFSKKINIDLFNEIINFVITTSNIRDYKNVKQIKNNCAWFKQEMQDNIQEKYEIKYLGELLERYKQKIGDSIENVRAIAVAIGYSKNLITENMIIGSQLVDFISKVKKMAKTDIYLKGALFLYDKEKYKSYKDELLNMKYENTEDIIYTFMIFENKEEIFENLKTQLIQLLGRYKTMSPIHNVKAYAWIIDNLYHLTSKKRTKDLQFLKALCVMLTKLIKEESNEYRILIENSYTYEEIAYLNYAILFYSHIPKTVRIGNSIVEEKIVTRFCKVILNADKEYDQTMYELIKGLIYKYRNFDIRYADNENLKEALLKYEKINIRNPVTFMNLYEIFRGEVFSYNILDSNWDILAKNMDMKQYENLFDNYIYKKYAELEIDILKKCIKKYEELTATSYIDTFSKYEYDREEIFNILVDKGIISLIEYYESSGDTDKTEYLELRYLKDYVSGIQTRNAFLFLKYILEDKQYQIDKIEKFNFNLKNLYGSRSYYRYRGAELYIDKPFLSLDEKKKLFFWLDNYMFKVHPADYLEFIESILRNDIALKLFTKDQLREIYFILVENDKGLAKNEGLREKYLTSEELQDIRKKEQKEQEEQRKKERLEMEEKIQLEFDILDKKIIKNFNDFCHEYKWYKDEWEICAKIVKDYIENNVSSFSITNEEFIEFMKLLLLLIEKKIISVEEFKQYITKYLKEREKDNGKSIRAS